MNKQFINTFLQRINTRSLISIRNKHLSANNNDFDFVVVGGGIIGLSTARELSCRHPHFKIAVTEKESRLATHQTGHNSGVIHAGIYYQPGSLKAKLCLEGLRLLYQYADRHKLPYKQVGKLIVATNRNQLKDLHNLHARALANNVPDVKLISGADIPSIQPHCVGLKALWSPKTGIIDFAQVAQSFASDFTTNGGKLFVNFEVNAFELGSNAEHPVEVHSTQKRTIRTRFIITCAGLHSDHLAMMTGCSENPKIIPFRGEYLILKQCQQSFSLKTNIYPVPDPRMPFLGVHFTPRMDGSVWFGPNALLAFSREGYTWSDIDIAETVDVLRHSGFRKLASKHLAHGCNEIMRSMFIGKQVTELQKYVPSLRVEQVERGPSGVRAQAIDASGNFVDDFYFDSPPDKHLGQRILHCRNAPSPGATSSMAIARMIADKIEHEFLV